MGQLLWRKTKHSDDYLVDLIVSIAVLTIIPSFWLTNPGFDPVLMIAGVFLSIIWVIFIMMGHFSRIEIFTSGIFIASPKFLHYKKTFIKWEEISSINTEKYFSAVGELISTGLNVTLNLKNGKNIKVPDISTKESDAFNSLVQKIATGKNIQFKTADNRKKDFRQIMIGYLIVIVVFAISVGIIWWALS